MTHWAASGVKCVCINNEFGFCGYVGGPQIPTRVPMINELLTVKSVRKVGDGVYLTFNEIEEHQSATNGLLTVCGDVSWDIACFRPLVERKTDISVFTAMLTPAGRIPVDA